MKMNLIKIKEILKLMLLNNHLLEYGLCFCANELNKDHLLSDEDLNVILEYIEINRPGKYSSIDTFFYRHSNFYWTPGNASPRIKWIEKHIKKLK
jgi:hypothetical protein